MYENLHMVNVALKHSCTQEQERHIIIEIQEQAMRRLAPFGLRATRIEPKSVTTRWLDVYMTFMPEAFGCTVTEFVIAMTVMMNDVFVAFESEGMCWWGLTSTTDELKQAEPAVG